MGEKIVNIKITYISDFPNHPFKVREDREMFELADSIAKRGVSIPVIVRPNEDGGYEMVAGHRRKLGSVLADKDELPCIDDMDMVQDYGEGKNPVMTSQNLFFII